MVVQQIMVTVPSCVYLDYRASTPVGVEQDLKARQVEPHVLVRLPIAINIYSKTCFKGHFHKRDDLCVKATSAGP